MTNIKRVDTQLIELAGRNWLTSQLLSAGIEAARPERDRGVDLIAYVDSGKFAACPIQVKAATEKSFSVQPKFQKFPNLILAYIWNVGVPLRTKCFALTYPEAFDIAKAMGWPDVPSFKGETKPPAGFVNNKPGKRLLLLEPYEMNAEKWLQKISRMAE